MAKSVFYDIADTPEEAANLTARSLLMIAISARIQERRWTQAEAATALHINQPRVSDLVNGKLHKFSLDALVNMLPALGLTVDVRPISPPRSRAARPAKKLPRKRAAAKTAAAARNKSSTRA